MRRAAARRDNAPRAASAIRTWGAVSPSPPPGGASLHRVDAFDCACSLPCAQRGARQDARGLQGHLGDDRDRILAGLRSRRRVDAGEVVPAADEDIPWPRAPPRREDRRGGSKLHPLDAQRQSSPRIISEDAVVDVRAAIAACKTRARRHRALRDAICPGPHLPLARPILLAITCSPTTTCSRRATRAHGRARACRGAAARSGALRHHLPIDPRTSPGPVFARIARTHRRIAHRDFVVEFPPQPRSVRALSRSPPTSAVGHAEFGFVTLSDALSAGSR